VDTFFVVNYKKQVQDLQMETFSRYATKQLHAPGFDKLPAWKQHVLYHLSMAGHAGRDIRYLQSSRHSLDVKNVLEDLVYHGQLSQEEQKCVLSDLYLVWICGGVYHENAMDRIVFNTPRATLEALLHRAADWLKTTPAQQKLALDEMYAPDKPAVMTSSDPTVPSAFVTTAEDVTSDERRQFIEKHKKSPDTGNFLQNMYLQKDAQGTLTASYPSVNGVYGEHLKHVVFHLEQALKHFPEQTGLYRSIDALRHYFETGHPDDFEKHALEWVQAPDEGIFYTLGFIETYDDPLKLFGAFQSMVGFSDPIGSKMIQMILSRVSELERALPIHESFKRSNPKGTVGECTVLVGYSGGPAPVLPLGNCLPNSDKIRAQCGSRSTVFSNVIKARAVPERRVFERFLAPCYHDGAERNLEIGYNIWVQLHECVGHASGVSLPGVTNQSLGACYNIIEECRADLVAMYFAGDTQLWTEILAVIAPDIQDVDLLIRTLYAQMITDALYFQLTRVPENATVLEMTHFRNRQINAVKVLEIALHNGGCHWEDGSHGAVIVIDSVKSMREAFGQFLAEIQRIKSEGDQVAAAALVEQHGTRIDHKMRSQALSRVRDLGLAAFTGFHTPIFVATGDNECPYNLVYAPTFAADQLALTELIKADRLSINLSI
jgi:dipeptidyl-peptidase-3